MRLALLVLCWCSASIAVTVLSGLHSLASLYRQFRAEKWLPRTHSSSLSHGCGKAWHGLTRLLLNCRLWNGVEVLICSFALVAVFVWVRIFWRRYDLMNSQRPFPWLDVEFKDVTDVECSQPAGVSPVLCVEWWELRCTLICTVMSTWTLLSWSTCNKNSSLCRTWRVCRLLDAKSKKREVHTMSMDLCNGCVRAALKKMFAVVAVFLVCFPAALVVTLPSEPYGGHSPAGHRPVQHYPLMISCPEPEALTRNITQFIRNRNRPPVETKERMTVTSIANLMAEGILQRWKRAELELAEVGGGGMYARDIDLMNFSLLLDNNVPGLKSSVLIRCHFRARFLCGRSNVTQNEARFGMLFVYSSAPKSKFCACFTEHAFRRFVATRNASGNTFRPCACYLIRTSWTISRNCCRIPECNLDRSARCLGVGLGLWCKFCSLWRCLMSTAVLLLDMFEAQTGTTFNRSHPITVCPAISGSWSQMWGGQTAQLCPNCCCMRMRRRRASSPQAAVKAALTT